MVVVLFASMVSTTGPWKWDFTDLWKFVTNITNTLTIASKEEPIISYGTYSSKDDFLTLMEINDVSTLTTNHCPNISRSINNFNIAERKEPNKYVVYPGRTERIILFYGVPGPFEHEDVIRLNGGPRTSNPSEKSIIINQTDKETGLSFNGNDTAMNNLLLLSKWRLDSIKAIYLINCLIVLMVITALLMCITVFPQKPAPQDPSDLQKEEGLIITPENW